MLSKIPRFAVLASLLVRCVVMLAWALPIHADSGAKTVKYAETDIIPIHAKIRFSTLIVLPVNEEILDATTGDKEFWIINGTHNLCYLHPAQQAIRSNLNLITSTGHVYSFLLTEISKEPGTEPDLKIFVERKEQSTIDGASGVPPLARASEVQAYKSAVEAARAESAQAVQAAQERAQRKSANTASNTPESSNSTTRTTPSRHGLRSRSRQSITTKNSPTSSVRLRRSPQFTKSRMASLTSSISNWPAACT